MNQNLILKRRLIEAEAKIGILLKLCVSQFQNIVKDKNVLNAYWGAWPRAFEQYMEAEIKQAIENDDSLTPDEKKQLLTDKK